MKTACTAIIAAIAACTAMAATTGDRAAQFAQWAAQHGKTYEGDEAHRRLEVFSANAEAVEEHNAKGLPWSMGLNAFSDLTNEEFTAIYTGGFQGIAPSATTAGTGRVGGTQVQGSLPPSVDWTAAGEHSKWYVYWLGLPACGCWSRNAPFSDRPFRCPESNCHLCSTAPWRVFCPCVCYWS